MELNIETLQEGSLFVLSPYEYIDRLYARCHDGTLVIPRYLDDGSEEPACLDHYYLYWTEETREEIKDTFERLQYALELVASEEYRDEAGGLSADEGFTCGDPECEDAEGDEDEPFFYDEAFVEEVVKDIVIRPDSLVTRYAKRLCILMVLEAPDTILNHEEVCLMNSLILGRCAISSRREPCGQKSFASI